MKKLSTAAALLLVGALALAGCTTLATEAPDAAPASPVAAQQVANTEPTVTYTGATPALAEWAEAQHKVWTEFYEPQQVGSGYAIYVATSDGGAMWAQNLSWDAPAAGELVITVKGNGWTEQDLDMVSGYVISALADRASDVKQVTATSEDGKTSSVYDREKNGS